MVVDTRPPQQAGLRDRTRRAVRAEVTAIALDLFLAHGYDAVTVEQISEAAGMSRRSFHRYFRSKDDVLTRALATAGDRVAEALIARPADEAPWPALRRAFDVLVDEMNDSERALALTRMMFESRATDASHVRKQAHWRKVIAEALAPRLGVRADDERGAVEANALAAAAIACQETAQAAWVEGGASHSLGALLDEAMRAVSPIDETAAKKRSTSARRSA